MTLKSVNPTHTAAQKTRLYTRDLDNGGRLDIVTQPISPTVDAIPREVAQAFESVILCVTDLREEDPNSAVSLRRLNRTRDSEGVWRAIINAAVPRIIHLFPKLKDAERTAYICPVLGGARAGFRLGYVVAWDAEDARDVAEYMAGGRTNICLNLYSAAGGWLGGRTVGDLGYSDVVGETGKYRRIIEGEDLLREVRAIPGVETPEPEDLEYPAAKLIETFTKLT
mgnify:CR=1 FL=1|jgi:hypothetical protein